MAINPLILNAVPSVNLDLLKPSTAQPNQTFVPAENIQSYAPPVQYVDEPFALAEKIQPAVDKSIMPVDDPPPAQYVDKSIMPSATVQTPAQINDQYNGVNYQAFRNNFPQKISPRDYNMMSDIYKNKLAYENLSDVYNDPNTTAENKVKALGMMNDAALSAQMLRNTAAKLGYDVSGVGADVNFAQATQNMNQARLQGMQDLMNMPSTQSQVRNAYYDLRKQGYSMREAQAISNYMFDNLRESNISRLMEGINAYGINADGSLNDFGAMMLYKLAPESPTAANVFASGYAMPKDQYATAADMARTMANNDAARLRTLLSNQSAERIAADRLQQQQEESNRTYELNKAKYDLDKQQHNWSNAFNVKESERKDREAYNNSLDGKFKAAFNLLKELGMSEEDATSIALGQVFGNGDGGDKDAAKLAADKAKFDNIILNQFESVKNALRNGDAKNARKLLDELKGTLNDPGFEGLGFMTPEDMAEALRQIDDYYKVVDNKMSQEELDAKYGKIKSAERAPVTKDLKEYDPDKVQEVIDANKKQREEHRDFDKRVEEKTKRYNQNSVDLGNGNRYVINPDAAPYSEPQYNIAPINLTDSFGRQIIIN